MKKYVIANWKMKMDLSDVEKWVSTFNEIYKVSPGVEVMISPSFLHVPYVLSNLIESQDGSHISLGVQNISANSKGSHTGEVGAFQVRDFCNFSIVGHSERAEDIALVTEKRDIALEYRLQPVVCFRTPEQAEVLYKRGAILAWEDPESISSGGVYNEKPIEEVIRTVAEIRKNLPEEAVLLYGGSANRDNIEDLASVEGLSGVLAGQASLDPHHFLELIKAYEIP